METTKSIASHLVEFEQALRNQEPIACDEQGNWYQEGWLMRVIRWIFGLNDRRIANVAKVFNCFLDSLEKTPVRFSNSHQNVNLRTCNAAAYALENICSAYSCNRVQTELNSLKRRVAAINYRFEAENGGWDQDRTIHGIPKKLLRMATQWKKSHHLMATYDHITSHDEKILLEAARFPEFTKLLYKDTVLRETFFKWTIRDHNPVDAFVQFPALCDRIRESLLSARIGYYRNNRLRIRKAPSKTDLGTRYKIVTLVFERKRINILDDSRRVSFYGNYSATISEIFEMFKKRRNNWGNLEVLPDGICNWCPKEMGKFNAGTNRYDRIDLSQSRRRDWWEQLPAIRTLTIEAAKAHYGVLTDGHQWAGKIVVTRETETLHVKGNHAYFEVAIPNAEGTEYRVYSFGKTALPLPKRWWDYPFMAASTVQGRIMFPDVSIYHPRRQHGGPSFLMQPQEGLRCMDWVRRSIRKGLAGNMAYQLFTENCIKWALELSNPRLLGPQRVQKQHFAVPFSAGEPEGVLGKVFNAIKALPECAQNVLLSAIFWPFGSTNSLTVRERGVHRVVSLANNKPWLSHNEYFIPARYYQITRSGS